MKLPQLNGNHRYITVRDCERFMIPNDSLRDLQQINILRFGNISELIFNEFSLSSSRNRPSIQIEIINCSLPSLPGHFFKGVLDEFVIRDSNITRIHMFALTGIFGEITNFKIHNSKIGQVDTQAFRKLTIDTLDIFNTTFLRNTVSKTFYDCHIRNVAILSSHFTMLMSSAFDIKEVDRMKILDSTFGLIESEAFLMDIADRVNFENNTVEMMHRNAFKGDYYCLQFSYIHIEVNLFPNHTGITMNENVPKTRTGNVYFGFHNNHINFIHPIDDMSFGRSIQLQLSKLYFRDAQNCDSVNRIYESKFFNDNAHAIYVRLEDDDENFNSISYLNERCKDDSKWFLYLLIATAVIVFLVIMIPAIFCYMRYRRGKQLNLIMPEPRTYRQTQIVMQIENTGLIKTDF